MEAYCVKCKKKREIHQPEATFTSSGSPGTRGICSVCGTKVFRMGRTEAHEGLVPPEPVKRKKKKRKASGSRKRNKKLVIVESPAKARALGILNHKIGKAVFFMLLRQEGFNQNKFFAN